MRPHTCRAVARWRNRDRDSTGARQASTAGSSDSSAFAREEPLLSRLATPLHPRATTALVCGGKAPVRSFVRSPRDIARQTGEGLGACCKTIPPGWRRPLKPFFPAFSPQSATGRAIGGAGTRYRYRSRRLSRRALVRVCAYAHCARPTEARRSLTKTASGVESTKRSSRASCEGRSQPSQEIPNELSGRLVVVEDR